MRLDFCFWPTLAIAAALLAASSTTAFAQAPPTLRDAVEAAWALSPQARSLQNRQAELDARAAAANTFLPGPPSLTLSHRTDRIGSRGGLRENEAELSAPLWNPALRGATRSQVDADRSAFAQQQTLAKIRITAEVRELAGQAAIARIEREVAQRKLQEARLLGSDIARRVRAGESARIDLLQAQAVQQVAAAAEAQAGSAQARLLAQWRGLTGLALIAPLDEAAAVATEHPSIAATEAALRAARAKLALTEADRRDPMEVGLGVTQERPVSGAANERSVKLSLRIPFGADSRNAAKLAAARAELDVAEAEGDATARKVQAECDAARSDLAAAREAHALAAERERLTREAQALIVKSWQLGEGDLPTRLRADGERFDAELASARAAVEVRRAISKINQSLGLLP